MERNAEADNDPAGVKDLGDTGEGEGGEEKEEKH